MHLTTKQPSFEKWNAYIKLMRLPHYIKNLLVFAPLIFGRELLAIKKVLSCALVFVAFCAVSSIVYIINDIFDREKDAIHPTKCKRPIAAGRISVREAVCLAVALLVLAGFCNLLVFRWEVTAFLLAYLLLNLGYSFRWKNVPILDIVVLVSGFVLRVMCGAVATDIMVSNWLYLTVIVVALFFSLGKRRNELQKHGDTARTVLKSYPVAFLDKMMTMCLTMTNVFYALWSMDSGNAPNHLVLTVPVVLLITLRYSMIVERDSDGDPVEVLLHDKVLLALCMVYALVMLFILYA